MQVDDQDSRSPEALHMVCSLQGAGAGAEEGSRRGRQRCFLSQTTGTAFTLKFTFLFLIALGYHTFIKDSWPVCAPPPFPKSLQVPRQIYNLAGQSGVSDEPGGNYLLFPFFSAL